MVTIAQTQRMLLASGFGFSRLGTAWGPDGTAYADMTPRIIAGSGLLIEGARTNLYTKNNTLGAETITPASGSFTVSAWGTGSVVLSGLSSATVTAGNSTTMTGDGSTTLTITPSGTPGALIVNAEAAAFKSSPIVTAGSAVTRAAETLFATRASAEMTSGTIVVEFQSPPGLDSTVSNYAWDCDDGTANNRLVVYRATDRSPNGLVTQANVTQAQLSTGTLADSTICKMAFRWATNNAGLSINGGTVLTDTTVTTPTVTLERLGHEQTPSRHLYGYIRRLRRFAGWVASDAQLQSLST